MKKDDSTITETQHKIIRKLRSLDKRLIHIGSVLEEQTAKIQFVFDRLTNTKDNDKIDLISIMSNPKIVEVLETTRYASKTDLAKRWDLSKGEAYAIIDILMKAEIVEKYRSYLKINRKAVRNHKMILDEEVTYHQNEEEFSEQDTEAARIAKEKLGVHHEDESQDEEDEDAIDKRIRGIEKRRKK